MQVVHIFLDLHTLSFFFTSAPHFLHWNLGFSLSLKFFFLQAVLLMLNLLFAVNENNIYRVIVSQVAGNFLSSIYRAVLPAGTAKAYGEM